MFSPWREATAPPTSISSVDLALAGAHRDDPQPHRAVGQVQDRALLDRVGQTGPGDAHLVRVARALAVPAEERQPLAGSELDDIFAQRADAQLGAGQVLQDRDRAPRAAGRVAHAADGLGVLLERSVRIVQPCDVHPGIDHPHQRLQLP